MIAKTPFFFRQQASVETVLTDDAIKTLQDNPTLVVKHPKLTFTLQKQPLDKKQFRVLTRKYKHKTTGEEIEVVEAATTISQIADFTRMTDFSLILEQRIHELLAMCKDQLSQSNAEPMSIEQVAQFLRPTSFLEQCNLQPPTCDFFQAIDKRTKPRKVGVSALFEDADVPTENKFKTPVEISSSPLYQSLTEFFAKRPVWTRNVLVNQLHSNHQPYRSNELKNCLQYLAYHYKDGPWKHSYVRFGYDPRKDRNSVVFQVVTLRFKHKMVEDFEQEAPDEQMYDPTFTRLEHGKAVRSYQLCDILDTRIKDMLNLNIAGTATECNKDIGWLMKSEHRTIYRLMKMKLP